MNNIRFIFVNIVTQKFRDKFELVYHQKNDVPWLKRKQSTSAYIIKRFNVKNKLTRIRWTAHLHDNKLQREFLLNWSSFMCIRQTAAQVPD